MDFNYSRQGIQGSEKVLERVFEILPGALSWSIFLGMLVLSVVEPLIAAVIMIAFVLYWVLRLLYMNIFLVLSYTRLALEKNTDWMARIASVDRREVAGGEARGQRGGPKEQISEKMHRRDLANLAAAGSAPPPSRDIYHLVIIPVIREARDIVEPGIIGIKAGAYPSSRILVIIALEDRAPAGVVKDVFAVRDKHAKDFLDFFVTRHPSDVEGEARVKGANTSFAAKYAREYFDKKKVPYENVIVSCFDADTVPNPDYFSCLTYRFMTTPDRIRRSYQPIPVYHNNIWDVPSFARIIDIGTSFFELVEASNPAQMVTFSSHSMSFKALVDVGFWPVDMISDDSAIFWKAFIHYDGDYQTVPIFTTVSMDIVTGRSHRETFVNIYKQKRRWAWGVENFPIVARAFLRTRTIPFYKKMSYGYKLLDAFVSWAAWSLLLTFISWLPAFFASREFTSSTVYYTAPRIQETIFALASLGIVICMSISILMLPPASTRHNLRKNIQHIFEWLFIPAIILMLSAIPALDAQTRLMFGRYMEFWVTRKYREK